MIRQGCDRLGGHGEANPGHSIMVVADLPSGEPLGDRKEASIDQRCENNDRKCIPQVEESSIQLHSVGTGAKACVHLAGLRIEDAGHCVVEHVEGHIADEDRRHGIQALRHGVGLAQPAVVRVCDAEAADAKDVKNEAHCRQRSTGKHGLHDGDDDQKWQQGPTRERHLAQKMAASRPEPMHARPENGFRVRLEALLAVPRRA
mmetsp:Transcript_108096/g.345268  ORF Transcript_108096/g.345268 Transcript_108096/m.345268 type:complete len:203 (+) Transcript_108096:409-1017(+)